MRKFQVYMRKKSRRSTGAAGSMGDDVQGEAAAGIRVTDKQTRPYGYNP